MGLLRICWGIALSLFLLGCVSDSGFPDHKKVSRKVEVHGNGEACRVLLDYANTIEQIYRQYQWTDIGEKLSEADADYRTKMSKLAEAGKWTPRRDFRKSLRLPFLLGRFHGALQSCKIERARNDGTFVACDQARGLKDEIRELCVK